MSGFGAAATGGQWLKHFRFGHAWLIRALMAELRLRQGPNQCFLVQLSTLPKSVFRVLLAVWVITLSGFTSSSLGYNHKAEHISLSSHHQLGLVNAENNDTRIQQRLWDGDQGELNTGLPFGEVGSLLFHIVGTHP